MTPYFVWRFEDTWEIERDPGTILGAWIPGISTGVGRGDVVAVEPDPFVHPFAPSPR